MQLYMSWYIRSFFGFTFLNILYFFKYSCANIFHRRSLYTFYLCIIAKWCHIATSFWVSVGSGNGFFLDVTKPLHEPNFNHHQRVCGIHLRTTQIAVHGANMGPTWALPVPDRPHVVPINLAIREFHSWTQSKICVWRLHFRNQLIGPWEILR